MRTDPERLVLGTETAGQAYGRFAGAINALVEEREDGNLAVVTHGTVMTLFLGHVAGVEPLSFWKRLGLPAFVALGLPQFQLLEVVETIAKPPR